MVEGENVMLYSHETMNRNNLFSFNSQMTLVFIIRFICLFYCVIPTFSAIRFAEFPSGFL